ncbi:QueG-associated DUF1730 domain-containing protein [Xanthomonas phaseoli]|uniref:QueG-associated DUF1730 domain-containing protein n=1 Tax=Xanthomonas phaseoli TaxID=1985254 RepID=UPI001EE67A65|nr:QueG-associated DUF1730 domain-containing protein [Xanthomonas phaseoli]
MDYGRKDDTEAWNTLHDGNRAYVARYALGRDYHKLMRNRLQKLAERIQGEIGQFGFRVFVDSAPVLERALARNAGLGWIGKHTCLIDRNGGSCHCRSIRPLPRIAAPVRAASISARRKPSSRPTGWMRAAASPTSP